MDILELQQKYPMWRPITKDLPRAHFLGMQDKLAGEILAKALPGATSDTTSPIVAQELAPEVIPMFVSQFPLFDLLKKVPSNGLSHTWLQQTGYTMTSAPNTIPETGTVADDANTYLRKTTNIAVFAIRRSISLKAQLAGAAAGGPSADLYGREVAGGLMTLARDAQLETLRYQTSVPASTTTTDPNGAYDPNGYNGLRYILQNETPPENSIIVDISSPPWTDQRVLKGVRAMVNAIWDKGGKVDLLVTSTLGSEAMFEDQFQLVRYVKSDDRMQITPGLSVRAIDTDQGPIPVLVVPGQALGTWTASGHSYTDIFAIDTDRLVMPYLGSPSPSVIRVPAAVNGQLVEVAIPFCMYGLAAEAPALSLGRISLKTS